ncbi:MAG TPA: 5'/3'-nucleotidase SurE [Geobacteraceae bacterium]|jgi:5'-nucleotidase|nr:5'/3'-nucleotidase SurE [Geobacteraceae bacterium]
MKILVTNDDGIHARGITILAEELRKLGTVTVVAPDRERSAVGHALTLHHPLRAMEMSPSVFAVDGTPTDCVNLGLHNLIGFKPDIVVSGINRGANLGDDVTYSGTVSAAMEATLMGIPAFAVSLATGVLEGNYLPAAEFAARLARKIFESGLPADTFLNVNVPDLPGSELLAPVITRQGKRRYEGLIIDKIDPRGRKYYWIGNGEQNFMDIEGTDYHAVSRGYISITPLHLDLTNYDSMETLKRWEFPE